MRAHDFKCCSFLNQIELLIFMVLNHVVVSSYFIKSIKHWFFLISKNVFRKRCQKKAPQSIDECTKGL